MDKLDRLRFKITGGLVASAIGYLEVGLAQFHLERGLDQPTDRFQVAIGNLAIALELALKALLARESLSLLYHFGGKSPRTIRDPLTKLALMNPESLPAGFNWVAVERNLNQTATVSLDECIAYFRLLFPDDHRKLGAYFAIASRVRGGSVHSVLPSVERYQLDRIAYLVINVFARLSANGTTPSPDSFLTENDHGFLKSFVAERVERVKSAIDAATERATKLAPGPGTHVPDDDWSDLSIHCPVCDRWAVLFGETLEWVEPGPDGYDDVRLSFTAHSFECYECGLKLGDPDELQLANVGLQYERSEELDNWMESFYPPDEAMYYDVEPDY